MPVLGQYCGNSLPSNTISSSNQLFLKFKSDNNDYQHKEFKLDYKSKGELFRAINKKVLIK